MIGTLDLVALLERDRDAHALRLRARGHHWVSRSMLVGIVLVGVHLANVVLGPLAPAPWSTDAATRSTLPGDATAIGDAGARGSEPVAAQNTAVLTHAGLLAHVARATAQPGTVVRELVVATDPAAGRRTVLLRVDLDGTGPDAVAEVLEALEHPALSALAVTTISPVPTGARVELSARFAVDAARVAATDTRDSEAMATVLSGLVAASGARLTALEDATVRRDGAVLLGAEGTAPSLVRLLEGLERGPAAAARVRTLRVAGDAEGLTELRVTFTTREGAEDA